MIPPAKKADALTRVKALGRNNEKQLSWDCRYQDFYEGKVSMFAFNSSQLHHVIGS